jgi:hypothetical protein
VTTATELPGASKQPDGARPADALLECGAQLNDIERHVDARSRQPSFDDGAVQHGALCLVVLRSFDDHGERPGRVIGDDVVPGFELNDVAVVEGVRLRTVAAKVPGTSPPESAGSSPAPGGHLHRASR